MNLLQRLKISLRHQGPRATGVKLWVWASDQLFDFRYGLDTCKPAGLEGLTIDGGNKERGQIYQPTRVLPLRRLFRELQPLIPPASVLVDLGCGKGRVLLVASEFDFQAVRGVEFAHELCEIARKNCAAFQAKKRNRADCQVIEADVTAYAIQPDETVFFMFNPFDETILGRVLDNLAASLQARPRRMLIIYYNPRGAQLIESRREFARLREVDFWGYHFRVYANRE
jgi:SAM-dependent methyltransferase